MMERRVVVTGTGVVSPVGLGVPAAWESLVAGRSGVGPITLFDPSGLDVRIAAEVRGFDPSVAMDAKEARRADRFAQFAVVAATEAVAGARLRVEGGRADRTGVIVGAGIGGIRTYTRELEILSTRGPHAVSPFLIPSVTGDAPAVQIALRLGSRGPSLAVASACTTGTDAIGVAFEMIRRGDADVVVAGGTDAAVTPIAVAAFDRMRALSRRNDDPPTASRPFDRDRDGFVIAEGAAILVLEELGSALARDAEPLAELLAHAATSDATHLTSPEASGESAARCILLALEKAGVAADDVSYVNAHATGTPAGDPVEAAAIRRALGPRADTVPVSATKSMTGHLLGAAGAFEAVITVEALRHGLVPPTINLDRPDPTWALDLVAHRPRAAELEVAISNSFGFGGHNGCLVLRRFTP